MRRYSHLAGHPMAVVLSPDMEVVILCGNTINCYNIIIADQEARQLIVLPSFESVL